AQAQTCAGNTTFAAAPIQVGAGLAFSSNSHTFTGGVTKGDDKYFLRGAVAQTDFDGVGGTSIAGSIGTERRLNTMSFSKPLFVCPAAAITKTFGPSPAPDFDLSELIFAFGGTVGFEAQKMGTTAIIPTFGLAYNFLHSSSSGTGAFGDDVSGSDNSSFFTL